MTRPIETNCIFSVCATLATENPAAHRQRSAVTQLLESSVKPAPFTIKVVGDFPRRTGTITHKAATIVAAMEGCPMADIIAALTSMDQITSPDSAPNSPRWVSHFAGLESKASGKAMAPWLEIVSDGAIVEGKQFSRQLLAN